MITFKVAQEQYGWAVWMGRCTKTPFWSRELAIREANCLAEAIRRHGESTEVIVEGADPSGPLQEIKGASSSRLDEIVRERWTGRR